MTRLIAAALISMTCWSPVLADDEPARTSLVERAITGDLHYLDERPEAAALELLDLEDNDRRAAEAVLEAHRDRVETAVRGSLDLAADLMDVLDEPEARNKLAAEMQRRLGPEVLPSLVDEMARALPGGKGRELRNHLREYWRAVLQDARLMPEPTKEYMQARDAVYAREQNRLFANDIRDILADWGEAVMSSTVDLADAAGVDASQAEAFQGILDEAVTTESLDAIRTQRRGQFVQMIRVLNEEQVLAMLDAVEG